MHFTLQLSNLLVALEDGLLVLFVRSAPRIPRLQRAHGQVRQRHRRRQQEERLDELDHSLEDMTEQLEHCLENLESCRLEREEYHRQQDHWQEQLADQEEKNRQFQQQLASARNQKHSLDQEVQQQQMAIHAEQAMESSLARELTRLQQQQENQQRQVASLREQLPDSDDDDRLALEDCQEALLKAEQQRERQQSDNDMLQKALNQLQRQCRQVEQILEKERSDLENYRLSRGELTGRRQGLLERIDELQIDLDQCLQNLPEDMDIEQWQQQIETLEGRIRRLGAVNMAAIDDAEKLAEKKQELESQKEDLESALATLTRAMSRMDQESRGQLKTTFETVNAGLQELFPTLFGGGQAHLQMLGDDWLSSGLTIMARPPGKRIGNIQLLSGGEKALTALALVFSIFRLNPAPFCLLDEVDAPLDEANVRRFGRLLQEMSNTIQFIFITHNKATMEIARQLTGVTMQEPGVSRMVAVDVDEAVKLAAA